MNNVPMTAKEYLSRACRVDQRINTPADSRAEIVIHDKVGEVLDGIRM